MFLSKKLLFALTTNLLLSNAVMAGSFPRGCEVSGYGFNQDYLILNEKGEQTYFLIQNRSDEQIELEHYEPRPNVFMSPTLESKLAPTNWAAFASDEANTYFKCYKEIDKERIQVSCRDALDVCQYPRVKFALSNMGNYWVSTNKPQNQVIKDSVTKGILLRW
jgi:hypothetical protein